MLRQQKNQIVKKIYILQRIQVIITAHINVNMQYSTQYFVWNPLFFQYSTAQYSAVRYSTVKYSQAQSSIVQLSTANRSTVLYSAVQYCTILAQSSAIFYLKLTNHPCNH